METKDNNPIDNVTWNGVLLYLPHYVHQKIIDIINRNDMSEKDAITLLGIRKDDIYRCRRKYLAEQGINVFSETTLTREYEQNLGWASFNINNARVA